MSLMSFVKKQFIDILQWNEDSDGVLSWRYPMQDFEIQYGGQLVVRASQMAVFVNEGQIADVFGMNGADDVDDGEFLRIGDDDGEAADLPGVGLEIHVGIVAIPFTPRTHDARPAWSLQLRTEFFDVAVLILIAILEFETFDVHALQSGHQPLDIGFIRIPVGKEAAGKLQQCAIERNVDHFRRLRRQLIEAYRHFNFLGRERQNGEQYWNRKFHD